MPPLKPLSEQVVVITGASSGIGRETARRMAREGARVVLASRDEAQLGELAAEITARGGAGLAVPADVASWDAVSRLASRAGEEFGGIDTWVNNAGIAAYGAFEDVTPEEFRRVIEVNFYGEVHGARAALPYLEARGGGALIFVGSILSDRAVPLQSAYVASKHAVKGFAEALRVELKHRGSPVQVTLVKPSSMNTPLFDHALTRMGVKPRPIAPVYHPAVTARLIMHCAGHRERDVVSGGAGKLYTALESFMGPALDWWQARDWDSQLTKETREPGAPNNVWAPVTGLAHTTGSFRGRPFSVYNFAVRHRPRLRLPGRRREEEPPPPAAVPSPGGR